MVRPLGCIGRTMSAKTGKTAPIHLCSILREAKPLFLQFAENFAWLNPPSVLAVPHGFCQVILKSLYNRYKR
jgi:hypothetical protein